MLQPAARKPKQFGSRGQDKTWVEKCLRRGDNLTLVKHLVGSHAQGDQCTCHMTAQAICDRLNWSGVRSERDYYYQTAAREYPRFMRLRPELDHRKYTQVVLRTRDMDKCLLHFSAHRGRLPGNMILQELVSRAARCTSADVEAIRIDAGARRRAMAKREEGTQEQVQAFLEAYTTAFAILEVHES